LRQDFRFGSAFDDTWARTAPGDQRLLTALARSSGWRLNDYRAGFQIGDAVDLAQADAVARSQWQFVLLAGVWAHTSAGGAPPAPEEAAMHDELTKAPGRARDQAPAPRVATAPMEDAWRRWLARQAGRAITRQPRLAALWRRLLDLGGAAACFADTEPDLESLLARGRVFAGPARLQPGGPGACHENTAQLWQGHPATLQIVTGYALSADGCWRQHSWLLDSSGRPPPLVETTAPRLLYFGRVLTAAEARQFWADCGRPGAPRRGRDPIAPPGTTAPVRKPRPAQGRTQRTSPWARTSSPGG